MNLSEPMRQELYWRYIDHRLWYPFKPMEAISCHYGQKRTVDALIRRNLVVKTGRGYELTVRGLEIYLSDGDIYKFDPQEYRNLHTESFCYFEQLDTVSLHDATFWQERAQALYIQSVHRWDEGGIIRDRQAHKLADFYKWLAILAFETLGIEVELS